MRVIHCRPDRGAQGGSPHRSETSVAFMPCLLRTARPGGGELIRLGHPLLDAYLDLVPLQATFALSTISRSF